MAGVCDNVPKTGLDAVTCGCAQLLPAVCQTQSVPRRVTSLTTRACRLFGAAVDASPTRQRHRLRRGAKVLRRAAAAVVSARRRGLAPECAAALADQYQTTADRASLEASRI